MTFGDSLHAALIAIRVNFLRSGLTALGIIIGVGAVIVMISVGAGAQKRVDDVIKNLGSNLVLVWPGRLKSRGVRGARGSYAALTVDDAIAIADEVPTAEVVAPVFKGVAQLISGNKNWSSSILGVTTEYQEARAWKINAGRWFNEEEIQSVGKVALLGETIVENLFEPHENPIGRTIRITRVPFTVVGTLAPKGETLRGTDMDDVVFVPISTAKKRLIGGRGPSGNLVDVIYIKSVSADAVDDTIRDTTDLLRQRHRVRPDQGKAYGVTNLSSIYKARASSAQVMTILLAVVGSISLIVGGIGIMNIMLVSVTERTREIGLRIALGARRRDILLQFLIEAVTLSLIGGLIGIALGIGGTYGMASLGEWPVLIRPESIVLAFGFSAIVGIFFGYYPARKAARLDPIDALRYE